MTEKTNPQNDAQRLQTILERLDLSASKLSENVEINLTVIQSILNGDKDLSEDHIEKIIRKFKEVSYSYLKSGRGEILLHTDAEIRAQSNMFLLSGENLDAVDKLDFSVKNIDLSFKKNINFISQVKEIISSPTSSSESTNSLLRKLIVEGYTNIEFIESEKTKAVSVEDYMLAEALQKALTILKEENQ